MRNEKDNRKRRGSIKAHYKKSGGSPLWTISAIENDDSQSQVFIR